MSSFYASSSDTEPSIAAHRGRGDGFFAHHGPWALGVRLFRSLNFPAKASLISVVFLFPLVVLCFAYVGTSQEQINFARQ